MFAQIKGQQCMEVRKAIIPDWNVTRMKRKLTMTVFWEITIQLKLLSQFQWSWYYSFQKTMFYLMKSKYAIFLNIKVTKIERSAFFWTPDIYKTETKCVGCKIDFAHHKTKCFFTYIFTHVCLAKILYKIILPHKMWDHL